MEQFKNQYVKAQIINPKPNFLTYIFSGRCSNNMMLVDPFILNTTYYIQLNIFLNY
ncbi:hypothetical protein SAMN05880574_1492 [Chryseobacterium sp. RU37D]|nr:hypothetical protein SAMN05880574_1492 [Chryseobacterium sp. RU37D]